MSKQFGGKITNEQKARYEQSEHWKDGKFLNLEETGMDFSFQSLPKLLYKQFFDKAGRMPEHPLPVEKFDLAAFMAPAEKPKFIWFGHSAVLVRWRNKTILIDPMLGPNASPIAPFATKRFSDNVLDVIDQFPQIDLLMMTHDHYDHLDLASIEKLKSKTSQWFVGMGVGRHLESWGVESNTIHEFDWWQKASFEGIEITFTPSRHFSGRGLSDRAKSFWGGWAFVSDEFKLYWSGDGGYGDHFKTVGERLGPFDLGLIECGQYNENWHQIHMYPEEAVQAAIDAGVRVSVPVHWGGFALALHHWKDPIERFAKTAQEKDVRIMTPSIGQQFDLSTPTTEWWSKLK